MNITHESDPVRTIGIFPTNINRADAAARRLACAVLLQAARDYRDQPIYNKSDKGRRDVIQRFIEGRGDTLLWHHLAGVNSESMQKLIAFAESNVEFNYASVIGEHQSIEDELSDVEQHIEEME